MHLYQLIHLARPRPDGIKFNISFTKQQLLLLARLTMWLVTFHSSKTKTVIKKTLKLTSLYNFVYHFVTQPVINGLQITVFWLENQGNIQVHTYLLLILII